MTGRKYSFNPARNTNTRSNSFRYNWKDNLRITKLQNACNHCWENIRNQCNNMFSTTECISATRHTIIIKPPPLMEEDEDELFGRTIAIMLKNLSPIEKNLLKIQIFSCIAAAQNRLNHDEYLV